MIDVQIGAFLDELIKIAVVPKAVKQYRHARALIGAPLRQLPSRWDSKEEWLFHGTDNAEKVVNTTPLSTLRSIISGGMIEPNLGSFGTGAYVWKDRPYSTYMRHAKGTRGARGVVFPKRDIEPIIEAKGTSLQHRLPDIRRLFHVVEGGVALPKLQRTTVVAPQEELAAMKDLFKEKKHRQISSAIFHRAEADARAEALARTGVAGMALDMLPARLGEVPPGLTKLLKKPVEIPNIRWMASKGRQAEDQRDAFVDAYERLVSPKKL